jgi:mono/diheme cytochrome c family protein
MFRACVVLVALLALAGMFLVGPVVADPSTVAAGASVQRWYSREHVERGAAVYAQNCSACHGQNGEGTKNWRQRTADGKFPPPPIDGTAHAWHHPITILGSQIKFGAPGGQGSMPGFAGKLSDEQIIDVIAWMQDKWPDELYATWAEMDSRSRSKN